MSTTSNQFNKFAGEIETFAIDWTAYLADANDGAADTISTAVWTVDSGITKDADSIATNKTLIRVSGGTAQETYTCQVKLTLTSGSDTPIEFINVFIKADPV